MEGGGCLYVGFGSKVPKGLLINGDCLYVVVACRCDGGHGVNAVGMVKGGGRGSGLGASKRRGGGEGGGEGIYLFIYSPSFAAKLFPRPANQPDSQGGKRQNQPTGRPRGEGGGDRRGPRDLAGKRVRYASGSSSTGPVGRGV